MSKSVGYANADLESLLTQKGDLVTSDGAGPSSLPVGTDGQVLTADSAQVLGVKWQTNGSGSGDVVGPASSTANAVVRFNGATGKLMKNSVVTVDDTGVIRGTADMGLNDNAKLTFSSSSANLVGSTFVSITAGKLSVPDNIEWGSNYANGRLTRTGVGAFALQNAAGTATSGSLALTTLNFASGSDRLTTTAATQYQFGVAQEANLTFGNGKFNQWFSDNASLKGVTNAALTKLTIGSVASVSSTATPTGIDLGSTIADAEGVGSKAKLKLYNDGSAVHGFGVSSTTMSALVPADSKFNIYRGTTKLLDIDNNGLVMNKLPIVLSGSTSGTATLLAADTTTSYSMKLPAAQGAANSLLTNDGSGNTSFATTATLDQVTLVRPDNTTITLAMKRTSDANNRFQTNSDGLMEWGPGSTTFDTVLRREGAAYMAIMNSTATADGDLRVKNMRADWLCSPDGTQQIHLNNAGSLDTRGGGEWHFYSAGGFYTGFKSAASANHLLTWPATQGAASSVLQNDGSGNLSWASLTALDLMTATVTKTDVTGTNAPSLTFRWRKINNVMTITWPDSATFTVGTSNPAMYVLYTNPTQTAWFDGGSGSYQRRDVCTVKSNDAGRAARVTFIYDVGSQVALMFYPNMADNVFWAGSTANCQICAGSMTFNMD